ncbi:MAG: hypothetical protein CVT89_00160 [Candidatus Altiarchaeales archaeon HGW-Altiarchaeales-2]|nr:MAG: hypothetical protein CVT89_00160 [Candidatus Altiarchaeales archaeon HGW-Altiarchaeales-2]
MKNQKTKVLVTDGLQKNTLAILRSVGNKYEIGVTSPYPKILTICFYSKYCRIKHSIKSEVNDIDKYAKELLDIVKKDSYDVILPVGLKSCLAVSKYKKDFLNHTHAIVPDYDHMMIAFYKNKTIDLANKLKIPVPETEIINNRDDIQNIKRFPVIIKSSDDSGEFIKYCNNKKELLENFRYLKKISKTPIFVQEYIKGFGCGFYGIYDKGKLRAHFLHKRIKEFPITGGPSTVAESYFDNKLFDYGKKICDALKWNGPIMVEFKYDVKQNNYKLIEINPKLWGSLDLTISAGINVPEILIKLALGEEQLAMKKYRDIKYRWVFPDEFKSLMSHPSIKNIKSFLQKDRNTKTNIILSDPIPTIIQFFRGIIEGTLIIMSSKRKFPHGKIKIK